MKMKLDDAIIIILENTISLLEAKIATSKKMSRALIEKMERDVLLLQVVM
jgi:hypothetical protein